VTTFELETILEAYRFDKKINKFPTRRSLEENGLI